MTSWSSGLMATCAAETVNFKDPKHLMNDDERCPGTNRNDEQCGHPEGWGTEFDEGPCKFHRGTSPDGSSHEANQNAQKHGLYALPEHLKENFTERQADRYTAYFEALCARFHERHTMEPDAFAKDRLSRIAIECVKERIADEYFAEQAEDGNLLVEDAVIGYDPETGPVEGQQANKLLRELTALKRETRLTLKDMGLLHDPDSQQAQATATLAEVLNE